MNLNYLRWDIPTHEMNSYDSLKKPMIEQLKTKIIDQGFTVIDNKPTKINENPGIAPSCLDLMITNRLDKITAYQSGIIVFSDHTLQTLTRKSKGNKNWNKKYMRIRTFKNFDNQIYKS